MLVEFRVKNFRSLRDEQVLSLVASKDKTLADSNIMDTNLTAVPRLLKSAVIYGANASGKSNLISALQYMRDVVMTSVALPPDHTILPQTFRLDAESCDQPVEFEVTFILDRIRYQYGFAMMPQRIVSEHLLVYKAFKPQRWFERNFDEASGKDIYKFSSGLKGQKSTWEGATRSNALFLSMAVQLNSEQLRPVFNWFSNDLFIINERGKINLRFLIQMLKQPDGRKQVCDFLTSADISIADIDVETRKVPGQVVRLDKRTGKPEVQPEMGEEYQLRFTHVTDKGEAVFDLMDESRGTRNLLFFIEPILKALHNGSVLVIDELDSCLHPLLVCELVRLFQPSEANTSGAQLIFTAHNTALLDALDLFRRDQVWLIEKDAQQTSALVALSEFRPRKNEAIERGYLSGRYGGVPFLDNGFGLTR